MKTSKATKISRRIFMEGTMKFGAKQPGGLHKVSGYAIHPIVTYHPNEWPSKRTYFEEQLVKAAPTLGGKPFQLDHEIELPEPNIVNLARWDTDSDAIYYEGTVTQEVADKLRSGEWTDKVSVDLDWCVEGGGLLWTGGGIAPLNFEFVGLSFLKDYKPGDPESSVELWETAIKEAKSLRTARKSITPETQEFIFWLINDPGDFIKERFSAHWINEQAGIQGLYGRQIEAPETEHVVALLFMKNKGWTTEQIAEWLVEHPEYSAQTEPAGIQTSQPNIVNITENKTKGRVKELNDTPQTPPVEPEKDEHGCIIGEETFDEETQKCVPIATPQTPVTAESIKEQGLSADEIKQKLADLNKQKSEIDAKLYPEAELSDEERATLRAQVDVIWAEISAYEKALAALYITSEVPTDTTPLPETITEQHDSTEPEPCPEGQHRDETGKCVPNEKLEEKIFEADYPWDKCIADMKAQGHDEDSANKICAAIKNRTVTHEMQFENCSASEAIKKIAEKLKTDKIFAYNISKFVEQLTGEQENPQSPAITSGETACPEGQHRNEAGICVPDEVPPQITENKVGPYASFEDCVAANQDKDNPEAYCASICQEAAQKQIITLRKELVNAKAELAEAKKLTENTEKRLTRLRERIKSVMPPLMAKRSWSWGPQRFVSEIESVLKREE